MDQCDQSTGYLAQRATVCPRKDLFSHLSDLTIAASTGGFPRNTPSKTTQQNPLQHNELPLFQYASTFSTFSGLEQSGERGNEPGGQAHQVYTELPRGPAEGLRSNTET